LKEFLSQKGVSYQDFDVSRNSSAAQDMINRTGQSGVPVTLINRQVIVGFDKPRLEQLLSQQTRRLSFGAAIADAEKITVQKGMTIAKGAYIGLIRPDSLAERLELAPGDIVIEINKQQIRNAGDMESILHSLNIGNPVSIVFLRNNRRLTVEGVF
jgi:S1-C subfamily serine protease